MPLSPEVQSYLSSSPFWVNYDKESDLDFKEKWERFDKLPDNVKEIMSGTRTADIVRDVTIQKAGLTMEEAKILAMIIRKICFGDMSFSLLRAAMIKFLKLDEEKAREFAQELTDKLFSDGVVIQLRKIEARAKARAPESATPQISENQRFDQRESAFIETATVPEAQLPVKGIKDAPHQHKTMEVRPPYIPGTQLPEQGVEDVPHEYEIHADKTPIATRINADNESAAPQISENQRFDQRESAAIKKARPPASVQLRRSALKEDQPAVERSEREVPMLTAEQIASGVIPRIKPRGIVNLKNAEPKKPEVPRGNVVDLKN